MPRLLSQLLAVLLLSVIAGQAKAAGVNLSWDACTSEGGVQNKDFACNTNLGSRTMYGSFILANDQPNFIGAEITIDFHVQSDSLPAWWKFHSASACRNSALSVSFVFGDDPNESCVDPWAGLGSGGIGAYSMPAEPDADPNTARLKLVAAVPSTNPQQLTAGTEYYCFKVVISSAKTVGSGSCNGCSVPMCILLSRISAVQNNFTQEDLTQAATSNLITWQSATECSGTQNVTWGQIRSLLR